MGVCAERTSLLGGMSTSPTRRLVSDKSVQPTEYRSTSATGRLVSDRSVRPTEFRSTSSAVQLVSDRSVQATEDTDRGVRHADDIGVSRWWGIDRA